MRFRNFDFAQPAQRRQRFPGAWIFALHVPVGGYKQSGNGREWGVAGLEEYLETKAILNP
jgi:hypothetical protein